MNSYFPSSQRLAGGHPKRPWKGRGWGSGSSLMQARNRRYHPRPLLRLCPKVLVPILGEGR